ncbi:MAG: excinuclease ABC subunit UvrC [Planctomycetaceae bacterium]|nr:excinuclease ABC subunit UvrC [Planctomycetaceae bacterium]
MAPMASEKVAKILESLPETPGVYFMKDGKGRTLYIGKAKNLRNRVGTYFHDSYGDPRIRTMVSKIEDIEFLQAPSEVDALLMEARLIKDVQPRYNDRLKDDKSFTMLAITRFDDYPKVWVVRETDDVNAETYGPFTSAGDLRDAVRVLQKIFKFATCTLDMRESDPKRRYFRPCILHAIRRCTAPCADRVARERYLADVELLRKFLKGGREEVVADLRNRMIEASKTLAFERAAELRDQIKALEGLSKRSELDYIEGDITPMDPREGLEQLGSVLGLATPPRTIEGVDIAHVQGGESVGSLVNFVDGIPFKSGYRKYRIKTVQGIDDYAMIREVVTRRFRRLDEEGKVFPDILLIDGGVGQLNAARGALDALGVSPSVLLSLAKEEETLFRDGKPIPLEKSSPALRLMMYVRDEAHRFAQHYHHQLRRKALIE